MDQVLARLNNRPFVSSPYQLIGKSVELRATAATVEMLQPHPDACSYEEPGGFIRRLRVLERVADSAALDLRRLLRRSG